MFFNNIDSVSEKFKVWNHYFPLDWKVTAANAKKMVSRVILKEFLEWSQSRIFKHNKVDSDKDLTEVMKGIFPNVCYKLFRDFLMLYFSVDVKSAIQEEPCFKLPYTFHMWDGEKNEAEIQQILLQKEQSQKEETINIIIEYFGENWKLLQLYKDDITEEESSNWTEYSEEQHNTIRDRVRKVKLQRTLDELDSEKDLCKESESRENQRKSFIELIQSLFKQIS
ncbi:MAG: hypothetical protein HQK91_15080 [Nitrospirae bacterium]|nr:hypothetical protein [Nitrospirota bacterium]